MEALRELRNLILRSGASPLATPQRDLLGLKFSVARSTPEPIHRVYEPVFSLVVQGEKQAVAGDQVFACGAGQFLVVSVDLPIAIHISAASA